ncbi:MAG: Asp23/Gls24 family envelope stress response protein, partial [Oscillospiraceae bacterium]|nr:Asp23/Gls24 family envelope stress response protein [Oscillospiraceae bacterium]
MPETREYVSSAAEHGSVSISEDVLAVLAASAAAETEGVHSLYPSYGRDIAELLNKKALNRSIKIAINGNDLTVGVYFLV